MLNKPVVSLFLLISHPLLQHIFIIRSDSYLLYCLCETEYDANDYFQFYAYVYTTYLSVSLHA